MSYFEELVLWIKENKPTKQQLQTKKIELCKKHKRKTIPTDIEVYLNTQTQDSDEIRQYLVTKPTRTGSGVAVVATMTAPWSCPHGACTFCPGGPGSPYGDTPMSYTGKEPSTMRGARNDYDPYRIIFNRLEQYIVIGQNPDKVEQIVMGGTFPAMPPEYQEEYVYYSFKAYNDFSTQFYENGKLHLEKFKEFFKLPGSVRDEERIATITKRILALREQHKTTLKEEQQRNETAAIRCIGLTIETKPDWGRLEHGLELLRFGTTRIELGVQTIYDDVLRATHRGHGVKDTVNSIAELRDLGFKLNFHVMPGLPSAHGERINRERDIESLKTILTTPDYQPDMLKIYPCMVMPGTPLESDYKRGLFTALTTAEAADIIVEAFRFVPEWCRIMRVQRDIPTYATTSGVDKTNLRQYVDILATKRGIQSRDIRAREVGNKTIRGEPHLVVQEYDASNGKEYFISMEADDTLLGFIRLRLPPRSLHPVITKSSALIRELHVYGTAVAIGKNEQERSQHKGFGKALVKQAEDIATKHGKDKIIIISGVGVRQYYEKLGYHLEGPYMVKKL